MYTHFFGKALILYNQGRLGIDQYDMMRHVNFAILVFIKSYLNDSF